MIILKFNKLMNKIHLIFFLSNKNHIVWINTIRFGLNPLFKIPTFPIRDEEKVLYSKHGNV